MLKNRIKSPRITVPPLFHDTEKTGMWRFYSNKLAKRKTINIILFMKSLTFLYSLFSFAIENA